MDMSNENKNLYVATSTIVTLNKNLMIGNYNAPMEIKVDFKDIPDVLHEPLLQWLIKEHYSVDSNVKMERKVGFFKNMITNIKDSFK